MSAPGGGLRRSMAWIHGWLGLLAGWILFAMFLTGTLSYFRPEITRWMQPERHAVNAPAAQAAASAFATLARLRPGADRWTVFLPSDRDPASRAYAPVKGKAAAKRKGAPLLLDPATGAPLQARETAGGELLFEFHYALHLPQPWGEWIAGACAMAMLSAIVSGVITHKRILKDLFTLRWGKGRRSWLDAHNLVGVLGLPYHALITYTGLLTLAVTYMPWAVRANFPTNTAYYAAAFPDDAPVHRSGRPAPLTSVRAVVEDAERRWGGVEASSVGVRFPGDAAAMISVVARPGAGVGARGTVLNYSGVTGRLLSQEPAPGAGLATDTALFGLHLAYFAGPPLRWMLFGLGLGGVAMVGTGLVLWTAKRAGAPGTFGRALTERLNIAAIACLPVGLAAYFLANRLIPAAQPGREAGEAWALFGVWAAASGLAALRPVRRGWTEALALAAALAAAVPVADVLTVGWPRDALFAAFDLAALACAALLAFAARRVVHPVTPRLVVPPRAGGVRVGA